MNKAIIRTLVVGLVCVSLAGLVSLATAQGGVTAFGWPIIVMCAAWAFLVNWAAYVPASLSQTERYYDLTGSLTYLSMIGFAVWMMPSLDLRAKLAALLVVIWAARLGTFLFRRISKDGKDERFDEIKTNKLRFFIAWTLQGLWVFLTACCALVIITDASPQPFGLFAVVGLFVWLLGFSIEVVADTQKSRFKQNPQNHGRFIQSGIWAWSRHPNYFGEMTLWFGMAIISIPILDGWQWAALISPIFVFLLINFVSGVNKLEAKAEQKWGGDPEYQAYKAKTPVLVPSPPTNKQ